jgi:hypothetical protein
VSDQTTWVSVEERLPEDGAAVLVYTPPLKGEEERIDFEWMEDGAWMEHLNCLDHYMAVTGGKGSVGGEPCTGPSENAPYTHWMPMPASPGTGADTEPHGSDKAVPASLSPSVSNYIASLVAENADLRQFLCDVAKALNNGSGASPQCSMQFLSWISGEVSAEVTKLRDEVARLKEDAERYRWLRDEWSPDLLNILADGWDFFGDAGAQVDALIDAARKALK